MPDKHLLPQPAQIISRFQRLFRGTPTVFRAPGRVNIIGEHTDYNGGFVLPAATDFCCWAAVAPRDDRRLAIHSANFNETVETGLSALAPRGEWSDYPLGVAAVLEKSGYVLKGANLYLQGEVPLGAGLSSSAAIEVVTAIALLHVANISLQPEEVAVLCQRAENEFVGMKCGVMDQFASGLGKAGHALFLDCRSLEHELVAVPADISLVICNSMRRHELSGGEYNQRREECEEGVARLKGALPRIRALRDVSPAQLEGQQGLLPLTIYRRCRHVVTENERVLQMVAALRAADTPRIAKLMAASHASLRDDFQVSTADLDCLAALAQQQRGCFGARMMGGGFGGCTISLVQREHVEEFSRSVSGGYESSTGIKPEIYVCAPADGAGRG